MRRFVVAALLSLPACYLSHELPSRVDRDAGATELGAPRDEGVDVPVPDAAMSCEGLGSYLFTEDGLALTRDTPYTARLLRIEAGSPEWPDALVFRFDVPDAYPREQQLIVLGSSDLAAVLPAHEMDGQIEEVTTMWGGYGRFVGSDGMCGGCGHHVVIAAGRLPNVATTIEDVTISPGPVACSDACNDYLGLEVTGLGGTVVVQTGETGRAGPLTVRLLSAYEHVCVNCGCHLPDVLPTGVIYAFGGG